ncbi:MAG: NAD-binding protein [Spirochaetes bacterium]|nr:NAD-binding protein [Spirochaetota bacterium]
MSNTHYIVCGYGHIGQRIALILSNLGYRVIVITNEYHHQLKKTSPHNIKVIKGDARDVTMLKKANIAKARGIAIVTDDDTANVTIALEARQLNPHIAIALRIYDLHLGTHLRNTIPLCKVFSTSAIAAPVFTAASKGKHIVSSFVYEDKTWIIEKKENFSIRQSPTFELNAGLKRKPRMQFKTLMKWWQNFPKQLKLAIIVLFAILLFTVAIFHYTLNLSFIDAFYFTITIITTVGFGDINLLHSPWYVKLYGIITMLIGASILAIIISIMTDLLVSFRFRDILPFPLHSAKGHIVVAGAGNIGSRVIKHLLDEGESVIVIEQRDDAHNELSACESVPKVKGNAASEEVLLKAKINNANAVIAVTNSDIVNLCVALISKKYNVPNIVTRIFDHSLLESAKHVLDLSTILSVSACAAPAFVASLLHPRAIHGFLEDATFYMLFDTFDAIHLQDVSHVPLRNRNNKFRNTMHKIFISDKFNIIALPYKIGHSPKC